jgi:hypothetical protein
MKNNCVLRMNKSPFIISHEFQPFAIDQGIRHLLSMIEKGRWQHLNSESSHSKTVPCFFKMVLLCKKPICAMDQTRPLFFVNDYQEYSPGSPISAAS